MSGQNYLLAMDMAKVGPLSAVKLFAQIWTSQVYRCLQYSLLEFPVTTLSLTMLQLPGNPGIMIFTFDTYTWIDIYIYIIYNVISHHDSMIIPSVSAKKNLSRPPRAANLSLCPTWGSPRRDTGHRGFLIQKSSCVSDIFSIYHYSRYISLVHIMISYFFIYL